MDPDEGDLEVIATEHEGPGPSRRRRRWPWLLLAGAMLGGAGAYTLAARSAVRALEQHWLAACDAAVRAQVTASPSPDFQRLLPEEQDALENRAEVVENQALAGIRRSVRRVRTIDPGVRRLRAAVDEAARPLNVNSCAPPQSEPPRRIDAILRDQLSRWRLEPSKEVAHPVTLPPVTVTTLPAVDERTGTTLVTMTFDRIERLDLDANRHEPVAVTAHGMLTRSGYVAYIAGERAFSLGRGEPVDLGRADHVAGARNRGAVWVTTLPFRHTIPPTTRLVDVDRGTLVRELMAPGLVYGEVSAGLVLAGEATLEVWDPRTQRIVGHVADVFEGALAIHGDVVAWEGCRARSCGLHLTDTTTGVDRLVQGPLTPAFSVAFSPDGRTLAAYSLYRYSSRLTLVDVASGRTTVVPGSESNTINQGFSADVTSGEADALAWSPAGDRVFFLARFGDEVWTYRLGAPLATVVRLRSNGQITAIATLISARRRPPTNGDG